MVHLAWKTAFGELLDGKPFELKLNKLNIYTEGGFFSRHVDTPAEDVVGSLVVILNKFSYRGGAFTLGNDKIEGKSEEDDESDTLTCIAFYADVPHSVEPVTLGNRVSLSFQIMKGENWNTTLPTTYKNIVNKTSTTLEKALRALLKSHEQYGILLGHQYSIYETDEKGEDQPLISVIKLLKAQSALDFEIHNVVLRHYQKVLSECKDWYEINREVKVFRCDPEDWNYLAGKATKKPPIPDHIPIYHSGGTYGEIVDKFRQQGCEHTGNNAQAAVVRNVYFSRVAVIKRL